MSLTGLPVLSVVTGNQLLNAFVKSPAPVAKSPWDIYAEWRTATGNNGYDTPAGDITTSVLFNTTGILSLQGSTDTRIAISPGGMLALFRTSFSATAAIRAVTVPAESTQLPVVDHYVSNRAPAVALVMGPPGAHRRHRSSRRFKDVGTNTQYFYVKWTDYFSPDAEPVEAAFKINTGRIEFYVQAGAANAQQSYVQLFRFNDSGTSYLSTPGGGAFTDPITAGSTAHYVSEPVVGPALIAAFVSAASPLGAPSIKSPSDHANWITPLDSTSRYEIRNAEGLVLVSGVVTPAGGALQPLISTASDKPFGSGSGSLGEFTAYGAQATPLAFYAFPVAPMGRLSATVSPSSNRLTARAPMGTLQAFGGATSRVRAPMASVSAAGTGTNWLTANVAAPAGRLQASGTVSGTSNANVRAPMASLIGYGGVVCDVSLASMPTLDARITGGGIALASLSAPMARLELFEATTESFLTANITAPMGEMGRTLQAWVMAPMARLTAIGTAVVTAAYEAYAVNLLHRDDVGIDEVTRYTNFPFTHIVRYRGSYFGANSTGLYLLEGATDDGEPIPWAVKTAMDDFGDPVKKTIDSAYFGGRFGPASTVQLYAGEHSPNTYSHDTPKDALAQNHRQKFGRGVKERYYALGASGTGALELDTIELEVRNTTRRV